MNRQKVIASMISLVLILSFSLFQGITVNASSVDFNDKVDIEKTSGIHFDTYKDYENAVKSGEVHSLVSEGEGEYTLYAGGTAVAIFVAGIIVSYLIDGIIIRDTGHSVGEWTAVGIAYMSCKYTFKIYNKDITNYRCVNPGGGGGAGAFNYLN